MSTYHVYPTSDLREHNTDTDSCWCEPEIRCEDNGWVIVHNSADGRELKETQVVH